MPCVASRGHTLILISNSMSDIKSFRQFLEAITKEITVTFGRFNPPTIGHEKLLNAVSSEAAGGVYRIYASHSVDSKKNPLEYTEKVKLMRTLFPKHARNIINDDSIKTILDIATKAYEDGFTRFVLVVGQDRVAEFSKLLQKYEGTKLNNGGFYEFPNGIEVVSAGDRDPDADDVEGMSASKMRQAVRDGNFKEFSQGLPKSYDKGLDLFNLLRKRMDLNEMANFREHIQLSPLSPIREAYVRGEVFNVGDAVRLKGGEVVQIVKRGPNFLVTEDNKKHWLKDVEPIVEETKISGSDLIDRLKSIGTAQGGFLQSTLDDIEKRSFILKDMTVDAILSKDESAKEIVHAMAQDYELRDYDEDGGLLDVEDGNVIEPQSLYKEPIVIIDDEVQDGYSRLANHLSNNDQKIKAWVANPLNIKEGWAHDEHKRVKGKYVLYIDRHNQKDELTKRSHIQSGLDAISRQPQDAFKVFRNMNGDTVFQEIKYLPHFYLV